MESPLPNCSNIFTAQNVSLHCLISVELLFRALGDRRKGHAKPTEAVELLVSSYVEKGKIMQGRLPSKNLEFLLSPRPFSLTSLIPFSSVIL